MAEQRSQVIFSQVVYGKSEVGREPGLGFKVLGLRPERTFQGRTSMGTSGMVTCRVCTSPS